MYVVLDGMTPILRTNSLFVAILFSRCGFAVIEAANPANHIV